MIAPDNHESFLKLFNEHHQAIGTFIFTVVRDHDRTEDILQETSIILWRKFATYEAGTSFGAWAREIARLEILSDGRRRDRLGIVMSPESVAAIGDAYDRFEKLYPEPNRYERLKQCIQKLPGKARYLIELRFFKGLAPREMAAGLERTPAGIRTALHKVLSALAACMKHSESRGG